MPEDVQETPLLAASLACLLSPCNATLSPHVAGKRSRHSFRSEKIGGQGGRISVQFLCHPQLLLFIEWTACANL